MNRAFLIRQSVHFSTAYQRALKALGDESYEQVLGHCEEALTGEESDSLTVEEKDELKLLRGTFYILSKQQVSQMLLFHHVSLLSQPEE